MQNSVWIQGVPLRPLAVGDVCSRRCLSALQKLYSWGPHITGWADGVAKRELSVGDRDNTEEEVVSWVFALSIWKGGHLSMCLGALSGSVEPRMPSMAGSCDDGSLEAFLSCSSPAFLPGRFRHRRLKR